MKNDIHTMPIANLYDAALDITGNIIAVTELLFIADQSGEPLKQGTIAQIACMIESWCKEINEITDRQHAAWHVLAYQERVA